MRPSCRHMPPMSWTSKWRMPSTRREPSRTTAKASGSRSSSVSPAASRCLNCAVMPTSLSSVSPCIFGSSALMRSTTDRYSAMYLSLLSPRNLLIKPSKKNHSSYIYQTTHDLHIAEHVCLFRGKYSQARLSSARIKLTKQIHLLILSDSIIEVNQPRRSTRLQEKSCRRRLHAI